MPGRRAHAISHPRLAKAASLGGLIWGTANGAKRLHRRHTQNLVSEAFYIASRNGHVGCCTVPRDKGADINCRGFFGAPGLHWAAINGHKVMVEFLIAQGADLQLRDMQFNSTPLGWALEGK
jgi:ankyrin repeat protein